MAEIADEMKWAVKEFERRQYFLHVFIRRVLISSDKIKYLKYINGKLLKDMYLTLLMHSHPFGSQSTFSRIKNGSVSALSVLCALRVHPVGLGTVLSPMTPFYFLAEAGPRVSLY